MTLSRLPPWTDSKPRLSSMRVKEFSTSFPERLAKDSSQRFIVVSSAAAVNGRPRRVCYSSSDLGIPPIVPTGLLTSKSDMAAESASSRDRSTVLLTSDPSAHIVVTGGNKIENETEQTTKHGLDFTIRPPTRKKKERKNDRKI